MAQHRIELVELLDADEQLERFQAANKS